MPSPEQRRKIKSQFEILRDQVCDAYFRDILVVWLLSSCETLAHGCLWRIVMDAHLTILSKTESVSEWKELFHMSISPVYSVLRRQNGLLTRRRGQSPWQYDHWKVKDAMRHAEKTNHKTILLGWQMMKCIRP